MSSASCLCSLDPPTYSNLGEIKGHIRLSCEGQREKEDSELWACALAALYHPTVKSVVRGSGGISGENAIAGVSWHSQPQSPRRRAMVY